MKRISFHPRTIALAFILACLLAYGLLVPWLGLYWDDWPYTWFAHTLGPQGLIRALDGDRPFLAAIYIATTTLFDNHPLAWQVFALLARLGSVLALWWMLRLTWPRAPRQVAWVGLLFVVYPGFRQHWISVIYSQAYVLLSATILSLGLMIYTLRVYPERPWRSSKFVGLTALALGLSAFSLFSTEYFFGLELIRPLLLYFVVAENSPTIRSRLKTVVVRWLPYVLMLALFAYWRTFLFIARTYRVQIIDDVSQNFAATILNFVRKALSDSLTGGLFAWGRAFGAMELPNALSQSNLFTYLVAVTSFCAFLFLLLHIRWGSGSDANFPDKKQAEWSVQAIIVGVFSLFFSIIPFWAGNLPFGLEFPYDRFTLAMMVGSALLVTGILEYFISTVRQRTFLIAVLIAVAIGYQFQAANSFRRDLNTMRDLFWQMSWRMPGLKPDTMLITYDLPLQYYSDNSLTAPLNLVYAPEQSDESMPYIMLYINTRSKSVLADLRKDRSVKVAYRAKQFKGNTSESITFQYAPPGCFHILDTTYHTADMFDLRDRLKMAIPLTDLDRILTTQETTPTLPAYLFGSRNHNNWCYYYETADLARQNGDWERVVQLGEAANKANLHPGDVSEHILFIEAYAHAGNWPQAIELTRNMLKAKPVLQTATCAAWKRIEKETEYDANGVEFIQQILMEAECNK